MTYPDLHHWLSHRDDCDCRCVFRDLIEKYVKELEQNLTNVQTCCTALVEENRTLRERLRAAEAGRENLREQLRVIWEEET